MKEDCCPLRQQLLLRQRAYPISRIQRSSSSSRLLSLFRASLRLVEQGTMLLLPILLLFSSPVVTAEGKPESSVSAGALGTITTEPFVRLDCDPCIQRRDYTVRAIVHGGSNDLFWLQVQASMIQAANDMGVNFQMQLQDTTIGNRDVQVSSSGGGVSGDKGIGGAAGGGSSSSSSSISSTIGMADAIRDSASELLSGRVSLTADTTTASSYSPPSSSSASKRSVDALIVTIPNSIVQNAVDDVLNMGMPVVVMNVDYPSTSLLQAQLQLQPKKQQPPGLLAYVAQDDYRAGLAAGYEVIRQMNDAGSTIQRALFINPTPSNDVGQIKNRMSTRYAGFRDAILNPGSEQTEYPHNETDINNFMDNGTAIASVGDFGVDMDIEVEELVVDPGNVFEHVKLITQVFELCQYDAVVLGSGVSVNVAVGALEENPCSSRDTLVGVMDSDPFIYRMIVQEKLAFGMSEQPYLQSTIPVLLASIFATTDKSLPIAQDGGMFETGPKIIRRNSVPSDSLQTCEADAFPICPNTMGIVRGKQSDCACTDRSKIRIGGVLHGITTDTFWDPVFFAANQAASDMGINLDLERFQPQEPSTLIFEQMAARIQTLCESGVDGLFVTIPSDVVVPSIQRCQQLNVPVLSVNSGGDIAESLNLLHHIGQAEYNAGVAAGERMLDAGMKHGYCLDHAWGNLSTEARCRGFGDAIQEKAKDDDGIMYMGAFEIPPDNSAQFTIDVERIVSEGEDESNQMLWNGVGLLSLGTNNILPLRDLKDVHADVLVGTFDVSPEIQDSIRDGYLLFGMDQQPFFQGKMPVYLLAYLAYSKQSLLNFNVQSGPSFITEPPTAEKKVCEANFYQVCPDHPDEEFNFLADSLLMLGYFLVGIIVLFSAIAAGWTLVYRNKWVVKVSQPLFLILLLFGCFVSSLSIIFTGVQAEYRFKQDTATGQPIKSEPLDLRFVDASCMIGPWLYGVGFVLTFSALFAKIQRVKMIHHAGMHMRRKAVKVTDVAYIIASMMVVEVAILGSWQGISPFVWERSVLSETPDGFPIESSGRCTSDQGWFFMVGLVSFHILCLFYALVLCFQTKDINSDFAESSYISLAVIFMFQMWVLVVPISALVQDNANVFYFVRLCAVFLQNFTVLVLIFVPKMIRLHTESEGDATSRFQRGSRNLTGHRAGSSVFENGCGNSSTDGYALVSGAASSPNIRSKSSLRKTPSSLSQQGQYQQGNRRRGGIRQFEGSSVELNDSVVDGRPLSSASTDVTKTVRFQKDSHGSLTESNGSGREEGSSSFKLQPSSSSDPDFDIRATSADEGCNNKNDSDRDSTDKTSNIGGSGDRGGVGDTETTAESKPPSSSTSSLLLNPEQLLSNWEELGLQSKQYAMELLELLNPRTTSERRKCIINKTLAVPSPPEPDIPPPPPKEDE